MALVAALMLLVAALLFGTSAPTLAQSGSGYDLTWNVIGGGGATFSTGGGYSLGGTIGQPGAGAMSGGTYTLSSGFWSGVTNWLNTYLPVIRR
ncbi:MAG: hypothetical protein HZB53_22185 [Chloroflexi bacterium]|nr:hypothetical protein [Chloroflexota bacterium]